MSVTPSHLFDQTVSTQRAVDTVDEGGGPISTYSTYLTGVKMHIQPQSGNDNIRAGRPASAQTYNCYCDTTNDIVMPDYIIWGTHTLQIIEPVRNVAYRNTILRIVAQEIG